MSELQRDGDSEARPNRAVASPQENHPIHLMLVDEDPVFRLGLKVWLEQQGDFTVIAEAETAAAALTAIQALMAPAPSLPSAASSDASADPAASPSLDLVILDLGLGARNLEATPGLQLCQQIKTDYPNLPVLVLSAQAEPVLQAAAEQMGADGYGTRSMPVRRLAQLIRQVANPSTPSPLLPSPPLPDTERSRSRSVAAGVSALSIPGPLTAMRISMRLSGQQQIDQALAALNAQRTTSWLKQSIIDGKKRELIAARWLVSAIWRTPQFSDPRSAGAQEALANTDWLRIAQQQGSYGQSYGDMTAARYLDRDSLVPVASAALAASQARLQTRPGDVQNVVFEGVFAKLQRPLKNVSQSPLEIDILRPDKKLELLYLVLRQLEDLLTDLRASDVKPGQLSTRASQVIQDLWDAVNTEFFGKYYTVRIGNVEEEVVILLQQEKPLVQAQILDRIPKVPELFGHWLFQEQMMIEGSAYLATTPQAIAYSEQLLENLIIQVANAVMQPLLNRLADSEPIKKSLYTTRLMSSREIERFRNDLSWRYRWDRLMNEPKAIFESRYDLYVFGPRGIDITAIYAPRRAELDRLKGIPLAVTFALETRDAISPRLRRAIALVGSSVVYVLTEVLGRGIGLVGRGILQGVGNAWQETGKPRRSRNSYAKPRPPYPEDPYSPDLNEWE